MNYDNGYLSCRILSPITEIGFNLQSELSNFLENTSFSIIENSILNNGIYILFYVSEIEFLVNLEKFLDSYREKNKKIRYLIECFKVNEQYPSLIRINKQLKKIRVKQKRKLMSL